jgi:glycerophosphoryl diester phosphodiesterase
MTEPFFTPGFIAMAHRGGFIDPAAAPLENTVTAFRNALNAGFRYLETDVRTSADGVLVAFHDESVDRISDGTGKISDLSYGQIKDLKIAGVEHIASMDELFETFPQAKFNIDLKSESAIELLAGAIRRHHAQDRVCVTSFSLRRLRRFRSLVGPDVATSASQAEVAWTAYAPFLPRLVGSSAAALEVPTSYTVKGVRVPVLSRNLLVNAHSRGMRVLVWTVNDAEEIHRLIDFGVDGILADDLATLRTVASDRGIWQ